MSVAESAANSAPFSLEDWYTDLAPLQEVQRLSVSRLSSWSALLGKEKEQHEEVIEHAPTLAEYMNKLAVERDEDEAVRYDAQLAALNEHANALHARIYSIQAAKANMAELREGLTYVETNAQEVLGQADNMLNDQNKLETLYEQISLRLSYFSVLPQAVALASSSDSGIVDQPAFLDMLKRLELALEFMNSNKSYADVQIYQMRLSQCVVRMMDLVRIQFAKRTADSTEAALAQLHEANHTRDFNSETGILDQDSEPVTEALYGEFRPVQATFRPLFAVAEAVEKPLAAASPASIAEFNTVKEECQVALIRGRTVLAKELQQMFLQDHMRRIIDCAAPERVSMIVQAAAYVHGASCGEVELYAVFFEPFQTGDGGPSPPLAQLLQALGEQFWTFLAPMVASDVTLDSLTEFCAIFQSISSPTKREHIFEPVGITTVRADELHSVALHWTRPVLRELRTRLVQRAQTVLKHDIQHFNPKQGDLMYPQCLVEQHAALTREQTELTKAVSGKVNRHIKRASVVGAGLLESLVSTDEAPLALFSKPPPTVYASWYAPVRAALDLLASLHTHIPLFTFIELGMQTVQAAQAAVVHGAKLLREPQFGSEDGGVGAVDEYLFELRHLLVLQELFCSIEIASRTGQPSDMNDPSEMLDLGKGKRGFGARIPDASVVLDTINSIWSATRLLPFMEPKEELTTGERGGYERRQQALKKTHGDLQAAITGSAERAGELAASNLDLPLTILLAQSEKQSPDAFDTQKALAAWSTFQQSLDVNLDELREKLELYLNDEITIRTILDIAVSRTVLSYKTYLGRVQAALANAPRSEATTQLRALPRPKEVESLLWPRLRPAHSSN